MDITKSLSIVCPSLNEEGNLADTIKSISAEVPKFFPQWEILIVNDGSTDRTGNIAERLALFDENIRVIHHKTTLGIGACYRSALSQAGHEYFMLVPGDNECGSQVLRAVLEQATSADVIIPFIANQHSRALHRKLLSEMFTRLVNLVSRRRIRYYNGPVLHRTRVLKSCLFRSNGFLYQAEILLQLLRRGYSYREVPVHIQPRVAGKSKALRVRNWLEAGRFFLRAIVEPAG